MTASTDAPTMLNAGEVAERLGVRKHRVYELTRRDMIPHVRIGRQLRYDPAALEEWIRAGGTAGNGDEADG